MIEIGLSLWFVEEPATIFKFRSLPLLGGLLFRHLPETLVQSWERHVLKLKPVGRFVFFSL